MFFLLLGNPYFDQPLRQLGHRVVRVGSTPECEVHVADDRIDLPDILSGLDGQPDAVVLTDDLGRRVLPLGLERTRVKKIWYAVDTPINFYWQRHFAPVFDLVLADQKDHAKKLAREGPAQTHWLPVGIDTSTYKGDREDKRYDIGFVGVLDERVRPKRSRIVGLLSDRFQVKTAGGRQTGWVSPEDAARLYRQSRMVLNENLFDGVTTRMLEGMASGSCLLTEGGANGLTDLFEPGRNLIAFAPDNLLETAGHYLRSHEEREQIAESGRDKVHAYHDLKNRAMTLVELAGNMVPENGLTDEAASIRQQGKAWFMLALRWPRQNGTVRLQTAKELLTAAFKAGASDAEAEYYLGLIARFEGSAPGAGSWFHQAAERGHIRSQLALALLDLESGRAADAAARVLQAGRAAGVDVPPGLFSSISMPERHMIFGDILLNGGHGLTPGFVRIQHDMSVWNAFEHYRRAVSLAPDSGPANAKLGGLLFQYGAYCEAHDFLAKAAEVMPEDVQAYDLAEHAAFKGYFKLDASRKVA